MFASSPSTRHTVVDLARVFMAVTEGESAPTSQTGSAWVPNAQSTPCCPTRVGQAPEDYRFWTGRTHRATGWHVASPVRVEIPVRADPQREAEKEAAPNQRHPDQAWMAQMARHVTMADWGIPSAGQYLLHDRDRKFCLTFQRTIDEAGVKRMMLPARSPNLNAHAERWVRSGKEECLSRLILFGEGAVYRALHEYMDHDHQERTHQGRGHMLLIPATNHSPKRDGPIRRRERLGGLLNYYTATPRAARDLSGSPGTAARAASRGAFDAVVCTRGDHTPSSHAGLCIAAKASAAGLRCAALGVCPGCPRGHRAAAVIRTRVRCGRRYAPGGGSCRGISGRQPAPAPVSERMHLESLGIHQR